MTVPTETLNEVPADSSNAEVAPQAEPAKEQEVEFAKFGDLTSPLDRVPVPVKDDDAKPSQAGEQNAAEATEEKTGGKDAEAVDSDRFDKHPRFKELVEEKNELKRAIAELQAKIGQAPDAEKKAEGKEKGYEDIGELDDDAILDKFNESPKAFLSNFAKQVADEVRGQFAAQTEQEKAAAEEQKVAKTFETYAEQNPDFMSKWESGDIQKFMQENPGHNAISAHQLLTGQSQIEAAVQKAIKETEAKFKQNLQTKRAHAVLSNDTSHDRSAPPRIPAELQNPKQFGGVTNVLAQRLAARRAAGG